VEIAVVMEEGVVLRRGSLVLCPFGGEGYCGVDDPFGLDLHQQTFSHLDLFVDPSLSIVSVVLVADWIHCILSIRCHLLYL
jgi:hypothetical protein